MQGRVLTLPDVWVRPNFGGKGRKMTGQLQAFQNGFRYSTPKQEKLDIMYRCGACVFVGLGLAVCACARVRVCGCMCVWVYVCVDVCACARASARAWMYVLVSLTRSPL